MQGVYTYVCSDCSEKFRLSAAERASRFRPRCKLCGSLHLEPVNKKLVASRHELHSFARRAAQSKLSGVPFNKKRK